MQYTTTRTDTTLVSAAEAVHNVCAPDGGAYVPVSLQAMPEERKAELLKLPFLDCTAAVLNLLLDTELSGWDIGFSVGRMPVRLSGIGQKITVGEFHHNPEGLFSVAVKRLSALLHGESEQPVVEIAIRCAFLCASIGEMIRGEAADIRQGVDIAVPTGDLSAALSAWYARQLGFPVRRILCCCNENNGFWELLHQGAFRTDAVAVPSHIPESDVTVPRELERLIWQEGGAEQALIFAECCRAGKSYFVPADLLQKLNSVFSAAVVGHRRMCDTISGVYAGNGYILSPYAALCFAGLQDIRTARGEIFPTMILSERSPEQDALLTAAALGVSEEYLQQLLV